MLSHDGRSRLPAFSKASIKITENDCVISFSFDYTFAELLIVWAPYYSSDEGEFSSLFNYPRDLGPK